MISSNKEKQSKELCKIRKVFTSKGHPKKFVNRAIAKQIRQHRLPDTNRGQDDETNSMVIARNPS